jgi:hypothetical protein
MIECAFFAQKNPRFLPCEVVKPATEAKCGEVRKPENEYQVPTDAGGMRAGHLVTSVLRWREW